jgi:hypothetical protein
MENITEYMSSVMVSTAVELGLAVLAFIVIFMVPELFSNKGKRR